MTTPDGATAAGARILALLREVTGDDALLTDLDVELYGSGLLDSLATVTLLVALEEAFGLAISPTELDRAAWATPRRFVSDVERRLADAGDAR